MIRIKLTLLALLMLVVNMVFAQLTGVKTIPGDYATVSAAVTALNAQGVGAGGVTFNVAAGHTETTDIAEITATGTVADPIIFQKSGAGANPVITRLTAGTVASSTTIGSNGDGIIVINGGDFITFDGIDIQTGAGFSGVGLMEYGFYLKKASGTDACKNVTIKNCSITLDKTAIFSFGIFVSNISGTATVTVTSTGGRSENIEIFNNTISNAYGGVQLRGFAHGTAPYDFYDQNNEVGQDGGNSISNFGGGATTVYGIYAIYQNNAKINNNNISGGDGSTSTLYGIFITTSNNGSYDVNNNTISLTSSSTTSQVTGIYSSIGTTGHTTSVVNITGNTLTNFDRTPATSGVTYFIYSTSNAPSQFNITNNIIGNSTLSGTGTIYGIYNISTPPNMVVTGNTISNITRNGTTSTSLMYGIATSGSSTTHNITVANNTIHSLTGNGSTGAIGGISLTSVNAGNVYNNKIYNITSDNASGVVYGMALGSITNGNIYNNLIGDLKAPNTGSSTVTAPSVRGINITSTLANSTLNLSFNTVYLNATSSGTNFGSAALFATGSTTATTANLVLRNNIFANNSTPNGVGLTVAYQRSTTSLANYDAASNNNLFYSGTPSATNPIFYDGTTAQVTLANFKSLVAPRETASFTENPTFASVNGPDATFLHISPSVPTQIESGGIAVSGITTDFDGNTRNATTPDVGGDEFAGTPVDLTGPSISYTPIFNTNCPNPANLSVVITDPSGVNTTAGTKPRLWFKKSTESNVLPATNTSASNGWKYVEATNASSPFTFTLDYSLLTSAVIAGDIIEYFVVAQDLVATPNVGVNSASFPAGYSPASVSLASGAFPVSGVRSYTVLNAPTVTVTTTPATVCANNDATLYAAISQPSTAQVGTGTLTSSTYTPYYGSTTLARRIQYIYTAAELLAAGLRAGNITSVTFTIATVPAAINIPDFSLNIGHTNLNVLPSTTFSTDATQNVFSGAYTPVVGANTHTFSSPFAWDGVSNIIIEACHGVVGTASLTAVQYTSGLPTGISCYSTNAAGCTQPTGTLTTIRANAIFAGQVTVNNTFTNFVWNDGTSNTGTNNDTTIVQPPFPGGVNTMTYTLTATDINGCTATGTVMVVKNTTTPTGTASISQTQICSGQTTTLTGTAVNGCPPYTFSWGNGTTTVGSGATLMVTPNTTTTYTLTITDNAGQTFTPPSVTVNVQAPLITGTTPGTACGPGPVTINLSATATPGASINWYDVASGGTPLATGSSYTTPPISSTTTYYAEASEGGSSGSVGPLDPTIGTQSSSNIAIGTQRMFFDVIQPVTILSIDIFPTATVGSNGSITIRNSSQVVLFDIPYTTTVTGGALQTIPVNVTLTPGTDYEIGQGTAINLTRNTTGAVYPYTSAAINITGNTFDPEYYYFYYNWQFSTGCSSPRVPVVATVINTAPTCPANISVCQGSPAFALSGATPTGGDYSGPGVSNNTFDPAVAGVGTHTITYTLCSQTCTFTITVNALPTPAITSVETSGTTPNDGEICQGTSVELNATGGVSYAWNTNQTGSSITVSPAATTSYSVVATDGNGCSASTTYTVTVNNNPTAAIMPPSATICSGASTSLTATGGTSYLWSTNSSNATINVSPASTTTYTVVATNNAGCTASASATVTVNPLPSIAFVITEPTTCVSTDGAINLTVSAATGPFTFNWATTNGSGLVNGQEDQANLKAGSYSVTVTSAANCSSIQAINLEGPGNCFDCPTFGALSASPTTVCPDQPTTLSISNLTNMGSDNGIKFKYSTVPLADPYVGGTDIATIPNGSLTGGGTSASASFSNSISGTYSIYAILDPVPVDPTCRPSATTTVVINETPVATATPAEQSVCSGTAIDAINLTSSVTGTSFNWTRDNTTSVTGIAASGSGNISGTLTNATNAPVTVTFTITPTANGCSGQPITATVTVNPIPAISAVANQTVCSGETTTAINFNSTVTGTTFSWTNDTPSIGLAASGSGNIAAFTAVNNGATAVTATISVTPTANGCSGTPVTFTITVNPGPTATATPASQSSCSGAAITTIALSSNAVGATFAWTRDNTASVTGIAAAGSGNIAGSLTNTTGSPITVTFTITPSANGCTGAPITATVLVTPAPVINSVANQSLCGGSQTTAVNFSASIPGTTFAWTNNTPSIGLAAAGSGNIPAFTAVNAGATPVTATITVTPTANGCPGVPTTFTITVNPAPTAFTLGGGGEYCAGGPVPNITLSGSQTGVSYQLQLGGVNIGAPVAGTGNLITFGSLTQAGNYSVVATNGSGCTTVMTGNITFSPFNCTPSISDPCGCKNNATTLTNGQFTETITVNAPAGQTWTVSAVNGLFAANSANPPAAPAPITVGTILAANGTTYTLNGIHIDALGYSITVTNGVGVSLNISNTCVYPNPEITSVIPATLCQFSTPITLTGNPGDANSLSQGFTIDGNPATVLNPANLTTGFHTITYTVNGGMPKAVNPDDPGCIQSVSTTVNVVATPTTVACNNQVQISLDGDCQHTMGADEVLDGSYSCYDDYKVELDKTVPFGNGPWLPAILTASDVNKSYRYRVTHLPSGNSCWGTVTIEDKLPPVLTCPKLMLSCAVTNYSPDYLVNVLNIAGGQPTVTENCSSVSLNYADEFFDLGCTDPSDLSARVIRTWTATDASGNQGFCTQTLEFERRHVDDVEFPADVTVSCSNGNTSPTVTGTPFIEDFGINYSLFPNNAFCEIQTTFVDQILPVCDGTYKVLRTWTVYDWCLPTNPGPSPVINPVYHIQVIKVTDDLGPTFDCPVNVTVSTDPYTCTGTANLPDVVISDNCSRIASIQAKYTVNGITTTLNGNLTSFPGNNLWNPDTLGTVGNASGLPLGITPVTYTVTDDCGNTRTCVFNVTIEDQTPPVVACDEFTKVALGIDGMVFVNAETFDDGSYDNCADVSFKVRRMDPNSCQSNNFFRDQVKFCCSDIGDTIMVVLRVYDVPVTSNDVSLTFEENNANDCMVQVLVEDKLKPSCAAPANVTVSCENFDPSLWAYGTATYADNCSLCDTMVTASYTLFDTACNRGTITRTFRVEDCAGQFTTCTQRVLVNFEQEYFVRFPDDRLVTFCDSSGVYGEPTFFGEDCELLAVSFTDEIYTVVPDACFKIERTWHVINWCVYNPNMGLQYVPNPEPNATVNHPTNLPGVIVSPNGTPSPWNPTVRAITPGAPQTNYSVFYGPNSGNNNGYEYVQIIKIVDLQDPIVTNCPASPVEICDITDNSAQLWNETYWWDNACQSHDLCEGPSDLTITATDLCSDENITINYLLFLDLDGDGTMETVVNSKQPQNPNEVLFGNGLNPNFTGGVSRAFDERAVPIQQKYRFALQTTVSGDNRTASVKWNTIQAPNTFVTPELPYGTHKIKWIVEDGCGNETVCEYTFVVKDCKKPTVVCINGLSSNIGSTGVCPVISVNDFLLYGADNCTPSDMLKYSLRRQGTGTGFPVDAQGNPITTITFGCADVGPQAIEIWAIDKAGNADFCLTYIIIQDNMGICTGTIYANVAGDLSTEILEGVQEAEVTLEGQNPAFPPINMFQQTGTNGHFEFSNALPIASDYTLMPEKDDNPLNGVTTFDLVLISRHILGLQLLESPYKIIAADANKNGTVTSFDIVELRKLILGIYNELPSNTSWRFVDADFSFPNSDNPFQTAFPEVKSVKNVQADRIGEDFVGIKVGDVNESVVPNSLVLADDRSAGVLMFDLQDRQLKAGEVFELVLTPAEIAKGYQFTLNTKGVEVLNITGLNAENYAVFADATTFSVDGQAAAQPVTLQVRAKNNGSISSLISVSSSITKAEAYNTENEKLDVALRYNGTTVVGIGFELYQNIPNPFAAQTQIGFHLPAAGEAVLTIFDENGRELYKQSGNYSKGYNSIIIDRTKVGSSQVLFYQLQFGKEVSTRKMIASNR